VLIAGATTISRRILVLAFNLPIGYNGYMQGTRTSKIFHLRNEKGVGINCQRTREISLFRNVGYIAVRTYPLLGEHRN